MICGWSQRTVWPGERMDRSELELYVEGSQRTVWPGERMDRAELE